MDFLFPVPRYKEHVLCSDQDQGPTCQLPNLYGPSSPSASTIHPFARSNRKREVSEVPANLALVCTSFEMDQISFRISLQKTQISLLISFYMKKFRAFRIALNAFRKIS